MMNSYFDLMSLRTFAIICGMSSIIVFNLSLRFFRYLIYKYKLKKDDSENKTILTYSDKIGNNNKLRITFENDYKEIIMKCEELEHLDEEWFLSTLVRFNKENCIYDKYGYIHFNTDEKYDLVMSIIKSVQYNKLILYSYDINFDLMFSVAEKWACPNSLLRMISEESKKMKNYNILNKYYSKAEQVYLFYPFKCKMCKKGFTLNNNKEGFCKHHPSTTRVASNEYMCCGKNVSEEGCVVGKHVPDVDTLTIKLITELIKKSS